MIDLPQFKATIKSGKQASGLPLYLQASWYDGKGDWKTAHDLIDHLNDQSSAQVHAYLHRKEGDLWNADYWYKKSGTVRPDCTLEEEWEDLVRKG